MPTTRVNDLDLHYELAGDGSPLLLLHGFLGSGGDFKYAGRDSLARRFRLIVPDLRGHGRTANPLSFITHKQLALDLIALLDQLDIPRVRAVGISMGANALLHLATMQPERVESMVLVSGTMYFTEQARAFQRAFPVEGDWDAMRKVHLLGDEQIRALWRQARAFADDYDDLSFTPPRLGTITARTLVVYGDRDPLYPVTMGVDIYRAIPRASLWVIPGGGHGPVFNSPGFVDAALEFLTSD